MPRKKGQTKFTEEALNKQVDAYFADCSLNRKPYTITGLCLSLDISRDTFSEYGKNPRFSDTIKRARLLVENDIEEGILTGKYIPTPGIFNLKHNFGWKDKQEVEHSGDIGLRLEVDYGDDSE